MNSASTTICNVCKSSTSNTYAIGCTKCPTWYHIKCVGINVATLNGYQKELKNINGRRWTCKSCSSHSNKSLTEENKREPTLTDIWKKLESMENKYSNLFKLYEEQVKINEELRAEITNIKQQMKGDTPPQIALGPTDAINEINERDRRKNNIMIFGCTEVDEEGESEKELVEEILKATGAEVDTSKVKLFRVGKKHMDKPRPIRVICNSQREARNVFFKTKDLIKNLSIST